MNRLLELIAQACACERACIRPHSRSIGTPAVALVRVSGSISSPPLTLTFVLTNASLDTHGRTHTYTHTQTHNLSHTNTYAHAQMHLLADSARTCLEIPRPRLQVLMAGGIPSYLVQDMTTTPRTSGTIILTTHALYWRQNSSIRQRVASKMGGDMAKLKKIELLYTRSQGDDLEGEWHVEACRAGPWGLGVTDSGLKIRRRGRGKDGRMADFELRYNFPVNTELRDTFVAAVMEVLAAHAFSVKRLHQPPGVLPPAVSAALVGSVVRQRAARSLASHGGPNRCRLPFSVVESEPEDSLLPDQLAELLRIADEREHRAAEAVAAAFSTDREQRDRTVGHPASRAVSRENSFDPSAAVTSAAHRQSGPVLSRPGSSDAPDARGGASRTPDLSAVGESAVDMTNKEMSAADAVVAAAAKRRELVKGTERAQATFAALPGDEERRIRRIKHNLRLIRNLITMPVQHFRDAVHSLLGWENPGTSGALFALLQVIVLFDMLHYTPAVVILAAAANVMETQKRKSREYRSSRCLLQVVMFALFLCSPHCTPLVNHCHVMRMQGGVLLPGDSRCAETGT